MSSVASYSRPQSCSSESSLHPDLYPPSILRRASGTPSLDDGDCTFKSISRRSSRVRFSGIEAAATSPVLSHRISAVLLDATSRRSSLNSPSSYRAPCPSDFTPRPLPMPRYNGPLAQPSSPETPKRRTLRPRPSADALRADLEAHRLSIPELSRSFSSASSSSSSSRRSSNRFSILSDPDDLDLLASIGGIPDFDEFLHRALPQSKSSRPVSVVADVRPCSPPHLPLPVPSDDAVASAEKATDLQTPPTSLPRNRALSPISGEDETTPMPSHPPAFDSATSTTTEHGSTVNHPLPCASGHGRSTSVSSIAPLLVFPLPPTRDVSLETAAETCDTGDDNSEAEHETQNTCPMFELPDQAEVSRTETVVEPTSLQPFSWTRHQDTNEQEPNANVDDEEEMAVPNQEEALVVENHDSVETPSSPFLPHLATRSRRASLSSESDGNDDDDAIAYDLPLHEAAIRSGILSYQSRLIWPSKPKRRHFPSSRHANSPVLNRAESTGWSGSESEEEEFNAALISIGRRRLARKSSKHKLLPVGTRPRLTPPRQPPSASRADPHRLSTMSQSSTSSSSSVELLTPDPHRTTFNLGPGLGLGLGLTLYATGQSSTSSSSSSPTPASRSWSAAKSTKGSELGIPLPTSAGRRVLPAPRRQVRGWGKPEILLEDDEVPLPLVFSPSTQSSDDEITLPGLTAEAQAEEWLMDETEPECHTDTDTDTGELGIKLLPQPARNLGVPF